MDSVPLLDAVIKDINRQDINGDTLMHIVARQGNARAICTLLKLDPDLSIRNKDGMTAYDLVGDEKHSEGVYNSLNPRSKRMCSIM